MGLNLPAVTHLLYLHGFRSSPRSAKAQCVEQWVARERPDVHWCCPQLPPSPQAALQLAEELTAGWPATGSMVIGSSLGGFYAAALAARHGWRSLLLNPAAHPARDLARYIGDNTAWHDPTEHFYFRPEYIGELEAIADRTLHDEARRQAAGTQARAWTIICEGDEVLDWREMRERYAHACQTILPGNDHAISDFSGRWPALAQTVGLGTAAQHPQT